MEMYFETKPTSHKSSCAICERDIEKGEKCLKAEQCMYPGTRVGRICMDCLKKGIKEGKKK